MEDLKVKQRELLKDTVKYYSEDINRRAVSNISCYYKASDGNCCAVGRLFTDDEYNEAWEDKNVGEIFHLLPIRIQQYGRSFLLELQSLHDFEYNWDANGLSEDGEITVDRIIEQFEL